NQIDFHAVAAGKPNQRKSGSPFAELRQRNSTRVVQDGGEIDFVRLGHFDTCTRPPVCTSNRMAIRSASSAVAPEPIAPRATGRPEPSASGWLIRNGFNDSSYRHACPLRTTIAAKFVSFGLSA